MPFFFYFFFCSPSIYIYIILILLYVDVPFSEFENDFDQALVGKNEDNEIIIYISGVLKLELYKKFFLDSKNSKLKFYYCDKENVVQLYWGKDFKYLKKLDNDFYSL